MFYIVRKGMSSIDEVISADKRCSNHTLKSFGVCVNDPLMLRRDTIRVAKETFGIRNVVLWGYLTDDALTKDPDDITGQQTVRQFVSNNPVGHFIIFIYGHAMAVHDGVLVDTSRKGISRQRVDDAYKILNHDDQIEAAFEAYRDEHPNNIFTEPKKRKPKYRFTIEQVIAGYKDVSGVRNIHSSMEKKFRQAIERTVKKRNLGKKQGGTLYFSKKEGEMLVDMLLRI